MNPNLIKKIQKFNKERDWEKFHTPENLAKSIAIEAGELLECYQWDDVAMQGEVDEELADIIIYSILMAESLNVDIEDIILKKLAKNIKKYPVSKAKGSNKKYDQL
jgi:NTP pyrophosphatase (non-canonical NTP hydrolase)